MQRQLSLGSSGHHVMRVKLTGTKEGLGIRIIGGRKTSDDKNLGIFIKEILPHLFAAQDGKLSKYGVGVLGEGNPLHALVHFVLLSIN